MLALFQWHNPHMTKDDPIKTQIRLPAGLHQRIAEAASESGRSLNAEMIFRLEQSFPVSVETELLESRLQQLSALRGRHQHVMRDLATYRKRREERDFAPFGQEWLDQVIRGCELAAMRHENLIARTQADIEMLQQMTTNPEPAKGSSKARKPGKKKERAD